MMNKSELRTQVIKVFSMDEKELYEYGEVISLSNVDNKAKGFLLKAIDICLDIHNSCRTINPMVVYSYVGADNEE